MGESRRRYGRLPLACVGLWLVGCGAPPEDSEARLAALEAEARQMDELLDTVETRLLGNQAMLMTWQELGRRHQQVSAVHCQHADSHLEAIVKHYKHQEDKARQMRRRRVASMDSTVLTGARQRKQSRN